MHDIVTFPPVSVTLRISLKPASSSRTVPILQLGLVDHETASSRF